MSAIETIVIEPHHEAIKPDYAVIWLHGLGADGNDFVPVASLLQSTLKYSIRFIFPHAPLRPVTLNNNYIMRAWYNITGLDLGAREDKEGLSTTTQQIFHLIDQQIQQNIVPDRIFLAGFSQGGAMALYSGLRYEKSLAGLIMLSGYLPRGEAIHSEKHPANQKTPIFWAHGEYDNIVPIQWAEVSCQHLTAADFEKPCFYRYQTAHEVCDQEIKDLSLWISQQIERGV